MTLAECRALLAANAHHPSVTPEDLQKRLCRGTALTAALTQPVIRKPRRAGTFADAVAAYLAAQEDTSC